MYIKKIKTCSNLPALTASFLLKLLGHEGILVLPARCFHCEKVLGETYFYEAHPYCKKDAPPKAIYFSEEEAHDMLILTYSREMHTILNLNIPESFPEKIKQAWFPKNTSCADNKSLIRY